MESLYKRYAPLALSSAGPGNGNSFQLTFDVQHSFLHFKFRWKNARVAPLRSGYMARYVPDTLYTIYILLAHILCAPHLACTQLTHAYPVLAARNYASYQSNYAFKSSKRCGKNTKYKSQKGYKQIKCRAWRGATAKSCFLVVGTTQQSYRLQVFGACFLPE